MKRILYVHGYNGNPNGRAFNFIKKALPEGYEIIGLEFDERNPYDAIDKIIFALNHEHIDMLIGCSAGAFLIRDLGSVPRFIINPCYKPSEELPKIDVPADIVKEYKEIEESKNVIELDDRLTIMGFFGTHDELLGDKYIEAFQKDYGVNNNMIRIDSPHHLSKRGAEQVVAYIPEFLERCEKRSKFIDEQNKMDV